MNFDKFVNKLEGVRHEVDSLQSRFLKKVPPQQDDLLLEAFEQLSNSVEELHVVEEELQQQNEQLVEYQEKLSKERERYQELFDFAPEGYIITDNYGKILESNRAASQLLYLEKNKLAGKLLIVFVPQETRQEFRKKISYLLKINQIKDWEIDLKNYQKTLFNCE
ncbi:MAG: PAS domain S-box protein, partial [Rivularia sp. (in: cyanobacteria)]